MTPRRSVGRWIRAWARLMARLYPPTWSSAQRADLADLLVDAADHPLLAYVTRNTLICARDAAFEWMSAGVRAPRWGDGMGAFTTELKQALRGLLRRPGYTIPALLTLALGIGINTAVFSVLYGVVLRPLPYPEPDELVQVFGADPERGNRFASFSLPDVADWQERTQTLDALAAYTTIPSDLIHVADGAASEVPTAFVSHAFFEVMGPSPLAGRFFTHGERDDDPMVAVVSARFFEQHLASNPAAVGGTIELTGRTYRLLGVAPASMDFPAPDIDIWTPLSTIPASSIPLHIRDVRLLDAVARLGEERTADEARAELASIAMGLAEEHPDTNERVRGATVRPLQEGIVGSARGALALLMGAAFLVLAIVCVNVANLAVARESRRETELAVRAALGASASRRMTLVLSEGLVLSLAGGAIGLACAVFATRWLTSSAATVLPRTAEIGVQWPVAWFSLVVAVATGLAFAILPGLRAARADLAGRIRSGSNRIGGDGRARRLLIGTQTALSLGLLIGAVMMIASLSNLSEVDVGFETEGLVVAEITFPSTAYPDRADYLPRYWATIEALGAIPGVRSVSAVRRFPFRGTGEGTRWSVAGLDLSPDETSAQLLQIAPDYFRTMGIPFVEGSDLPQSVDEGGLIPVVVSRAVAERAFPGERAEGRLLNLGDTELLVRGVVDDVLQSGLVDEATPLIYVPQEADPRRGAWFVMSTDGSAGLLQRVRDAVRASDPAQPISELATVQTLLGEQLARPALFTSLLSFFALSALLLSALGVYGVIAFGVERRRREIGIRMALGADRGRVRAMVVRDGMVPIVLGAVAGLVASASGARVMESLVFGMGVRSAGVYAVAVAAIMGTGVLACYLPARRASRVEVTRALEGEG